jgi:hypothetical protein
MPQKIAEPMELIHSWLEEFRADKRASQKSGADNEAGGDNTKSTTHPVMGADAQTSPAQEGAHAKELTSDVSDQIGGDPMTGQTDANTATSDQPSDEMGTKKMDADQVRGNIKKPKATKDDPGSSNPATVGQEKYGEMRKASEFLLQYFANLGVKEAQAAVKKADEESEAEEKKEAEKGEKEGPGPDESPEHEAAEGEKKAAIERYPDDFDNGFVAAAMVLQQMGLSKEAEITTDNLINDQIASIVSTARQDADNAIDYLEGFAKGAATKQAAAGMPLPPELLAGAGGAGAGGGEGDEAAAQEALASEGAPEEGGEAGGMPPGLEGGGEGGEGGGGDESEDAIINALAEAGVTPEELEAALAEAGGAGGAGGAEGAGALPPEVEKAASSFQRKVAAHVNRKRLFQMLKS